MAGRFGSGEPLNLPVNKKNRKDAEKRQDEKSGCCCRQLPLNSNHLL